MVKKGLIAASRGKGELVYALIPFVVGSYEAQLPRMDAEYAELFEQYYCETQGGLAREGPSLHRVIPVGQAIRAGLEVYPHERATELIENAEAWAVRDCICRVQQKLIGKGCDAPVENCISFAPIEGCFDHTAVGRAISKQEALQILQEAADAGLVHSAGNYRDGNHYICNCCTCCCGVLRAVAEYSRPTAIARSDFYMTVDERLCIGCASCVGRCSFDALSVPGEVCVVDEGRCVGCGVCAVACPVDALTLARRAEEERVPVPPNHKAWLRERAERRGITLDGLIS
jgi:ferredoxin